MGSHVTTVKLTRLTCSRCGARVEGGLFAGIPAVLHESEGRCPSCHGGLFRAVFSVKRSSEAGMSGALPGVAGYLMFGALGSMAADSMWGDASSGKSEYECELRGVDGRQLLEKLELPPREAASWIQSVIKETTKANLASDQGICNQCGEVFKIGLAGHTVDGYCSPGCKKRDLKNLPSAVQASAAGPAAAREVHCPHCNRKVHVKPGGRCMYCGKTVLI